MGGSIVRFARLNNSPSILIGGAACPLSVRDLRSTSGPVSLSGCSAATAPMASSRLRTYDCSGVTDIRRHRHRTLHRGVRRGTVRTVTPSKGATAAPMLLAANRISTSNAHGGVAPTSLLRYGGTYSGVGVPGGSHVLMLYDSRVGSLLRASRGFGSRCGVGRARNGVTHLCNFSVCRCSNAPCCGITTGAGLT